MLRAHLTVRCVVNFANQVEPPVVIHTLPLTTLGGAVEGAQVGNWSAGSHAMVKAVVHQAGDDIDSAACARLLACPVRP